MTEKSGSASPAEVFRDAMLEVFEKLLALPDEQREATLKAWIAGLGGKLPTEDRQDEPRRVN